MTLQDVGSGLQGVGTAGTLGRVGLLPLNERCSNTALVSVEFNNPPAHSERSGVHG